MRNQTVQKGFRTILLKRVGVYALLIAVTFMTISLFMVVLGYDAVKALATLTTTAFKSAFGFKECIKKTIPLIFTSYAFTIPFTMRFFNIGGLGQMLFGGAVTAVVGLLFAGAGLPAFIFIPFLLLVGIISGGGFALIAGFLKSNYDINPIVSTIMLNFVALLFVNLITTVPFFADPREGHPTTYPIPEAARLGDFSGIPQSIILAFLAVVFAYTLLKRTKLGFEITAVGYNITAAQVYGISFKRAIMLAFFIGGGFAGLGGCLEVINVHGKLLEGFTQTSGAQYGVFGILTSLIVAGNPVGIPIAAFFMSVLLVGADALQRTMQIPVEFVFLSQALIVLTTVIARRRLITGIK